jgi:hypothetical protein
MDRTTRTADEKPPLLQEEEGDSLPVLLAKAAALSTAIDGQAAQLAAGLGKQLSGLHGMEPMVPAAPAAAPAEFDPGALVAQAQEQLVATIARLRGLAEGMGVAPAVAAPGAPPDPLGLLLAGLAGHAQAQLGVQPGMAAAGPAIPPADVDLKAIVSSAQAAHDQAQRAMHDLLVGMGLDPADPSAGLAKLKPSTPAAPPAAAPTGMPGGDLMGSMQADVQRLQAMLGELSAKIVPPP